jgi:hypothetical protein
LIVLSVIVYVLRQNCRAAGWRWDTKIMQATTNTVINEATADPPEIFQNLQNQVEELIKKVEALNNRPAKNWYNKPTQRRRQDSTPDVRPCWYHMKFGSRAHRCQPPCSFQAENL